MDWIATIVSVPAILAAVNILKSRGLPTNWAPIIAIAFGALFGAAASYIQSQSFDNMPSAILFGIITGLSASGIYDVTKIDPNATPITTVNVSAPEQSPVVGGGAY